MTDRGTGDVCTCACMRGCAWTCAPACTPAWMYVCTVHTRVCPHMRTHPCPVPRRGALQTSQHHQGRGAVSRALGWVPGEAENRRIPLLTATPTIIKKLELLKLPRAGGGARLGKDHPLPRGGAFESTPWTAARRRLRAASDPGGEAQNTSSWSQIQAGELSKRTLHSS